MNVLLVDDEPLALEALQRGLSRLRAPDWKVAIAHSASEAVGRLELEATDLVITDVVMPGRGGAWLLEQVSRRWPGVVRVALSGTPTRELPPEELRHAHQVLAKPCPTVVLTGILRRTRMMRDLLANPALAALAAQLERLPPAPAAYKELSALLAHGDVPMSRVSGAIERDPALATRVLQLVNSAYFRSAEPIRTVHAAACRLGTRTLENVVLAAGVAGWARALPGSGRVDVTGISARAAASARIARELSPQLGVGDTPVTIGLLAELGTMVLAAVGHVPTPSVQASSQHIACTAGLLPAHTAGYMLCLWGVPEDIVLGVAHQHEPWRLEPDAIGPVSVAHVAIALAAGGTPDFAQLARTRREQLLAGCRPFLDRIATHG